MKVESEIMEDLAKIVELKTQEIKCWRNLVDKHADGDNQLKQFESLFGNTKEDFAKFKDKILKNHETADILEAKLNKALADRSRIIEALNSDIQSLKRSIENQTTENELLEKRLKEDAEKLNKLKYTSDYSNSYQGNSLAEPGQFIQRLRRELK